MRRMGMAALVAVGLTARDREPDEGTRSGAPHVRADPASDWNAITTRVMDANGLSPATAALGLAMVHASTYDAMINIDGGFAPYHVVLREATGSSTSAGARAARDTLVQLLPDQTASIEKEYVNYLALHKLTADDPGVAVGAEAAPEIIALRRADGRFLSPEVPPYLGKTEMGQWRPTPSLEPGRAGPENASPRSHRHRTAPWRPAGHSRRARVVRDAGVGADLSRARRQ